MIEQMIVIAGGILLAIFVLVHMRLIVNIILILFAIIAVSFIFLHPEILNLILALATPIFLFWALLKIPAVKKRAMVFFEDLRE